MGATRKCDLEEEIKELMKKKKLTRKEAIFQLRKKE